MNKINRIYIYFKEIIRAILNLTPKNKLQFERCNPMGGGDLCFLSVTALERGLDGGDDRFADYFFALYHCSPDEPSGIKTRREEIREIFPDKAIKVGKYFILTGEAAYLILAAYYQALMISDKFSENFRAYASECLDRVIKGHEDSQSLPIPIDLTEAQLSHNPLLEILTCVAIRNGQVHSLIDLKAEC